MFIRIRMCSCHRTFQFLAPARFGICGRVVLFHLSFKFLRLTVVVFHFYALISNFLSKLNIRRKFKVAERLKFPFLNFGSFHRDVRSLDSI